jgi:hypothetical protein
MSGERSLPRSFRSAVPDVKTLLATFPVAPDSTVIFEFELLSDLFAWVHDQLAVANSRKPATRISL